MHEVEDQHNGTEDSSVRAGLNDNLHSDSSLPYLSQVFYNASIPLCPYNIDNMLRMRQSFRDAEPPRDFYRDIGGPYELEREHKDHGAHEENILSLGGRRAIGLELFDENEPRLSEGQKKVRKMANEAMRK